MVFSSAIHTSHQVYTPLSRGTRRSNANKGRRFQPIQAQQVDGYRFSTSEGPIPKPVIKEENKSSGKRVPFMAGNWKTNPTSLQEVESLSALLATAAKNHARDKPDTEIEIAVFPPHPFLPIVTDRLSDTSIQVGAQDVYHEAKGAFTGEVSVGMVKSLGATHVLCGHSERRTLFGEDNAAVNKKVRAVLDAGLQVVLCIGETQEEYLAGQVREVCATQLAGALNGVSRLEVRDSVTVAYEPVWAIGTGLTASPAIAQSVHSYLRYWLDSVYGAEVAGAVRLQYGGSVSPDNVDDIMACPDVDGCLVGGASLVADKFTRIFNFKSQSSVTPKSFAREVLACANVLGESPVWSVAQQKLYWVSSAGMQLWEWDLENQARHWQFSEVVGCCALQPNGELLLGLEEHGLVNFSPSTGAFSAVCGFEEGMNTRPNDGRCDREGNFVIGSYNNNHRGDGKDLGGLYRLDAQDKSLQEILDYRFRCSNCICFTPDGRKMFFCDTPTRRIFTFDYSPSGMLSNRQLLWEMPNHLEGGPDGAQCDQRGNIWAALSGAGQVVCIAPDGTVDHVVELPVKSPTSCTFGGPELNTLFITTRGPDGGGLYAVDLPAGIHGIPEPEFGYMNTWSSPAVSAAIPTTNVTSYF